jgi:flagellar basal-body rod modification protein FlgD
MDINGVSTGTQQTTQASANALSNLSEDYTRFITLLTAQIQNQDPLSPMDSTEFVSQLAQLSQVEQSVQTNANLETVAAQIASLNAMTGVNMIGRDVTFGSNLVELDAEGNNQTFYQLPGEAVEIEAVISDAEGHEFRTLSNLSGDAGREIAFDWDGRDNIGQEVLPGEYSVSFTAKDAAGESVPVYVFRTAEVKETLLDQGNLYYGVTGGEVLSSESVLSIQ